MYSRSSFFKSASLTFAEASSSSRTAFSAYLRASGSCWLASANSYPMSLNQRGRGSISNGFLKGCYRLVVVACTHVMRIQSNVKTRLIRTQLDCRFQRVSSLRVALQRSKCNAELGKCFVFSGFAVTTSRRTETASSYFADFQEAGDQRLVGYG